jgi:hypothetical protein
MRTKLAAFLLVAALTTVFAGAAIAAQPTPENEPAAVTAEAPAPAESLPELELTGGTCGISFPTFIDLDGPTPDFLACGCRDLCRKDSDCFFRCGGEPGVCVMVNSCCKDCVCSAAS